MARLRGFRPRGLVGNKRQVAWGFGPDAVPVSLAATGNLFWTNAVTLTTAAKTTIVRIRGNFQAFLLTAAAAGDGFDGAIGIGLATTEAVAAGIAAVPGPRTDPEWGGWIAHQVFHIHAVTATIADGVNAAAAQVTMNIDSKAMRKFEESQSLFGAVEVLENGAATAELWADTRILVKLL